MGKRSQRRSSAEIQSLGKSYTSKKAVEEIRTVKIGCPRRSMSVDSKSTRKIPKNTIRKKPITL
jgi:hypothetical protein